MEGTHLNIVIYELRKKLREYEEERAELLKIVDTTLSAEIKEKINYLDYSIASIQDALKRIS